MSSGSEDLDGFRLSTGTLEFVSGLVGYFFRGDDALGMANDMTAMAKSLRDGSLDACSVADWLDKTAKEFGRVKRMGAN